MNSIQERASLSRRAVFAATTFAAGAAAGLAQAQTSPTARTAKTSGYATAGDGLKIYYEVHGGPVGRRTPLVLLHGGMLAIETGFPPELIARLARTRPVIAIEQQGHGHTADRPTGHTVEQMADDTAAVLRSLGVDKAHFMGFSLGGMITLAMAIGHPGRVASLTPISASYNLDGMLPELAALQRGQSQQAPPEIAALFPTERDFAAWKAHYDRAAPDPSAFERVLGKLNAMLGKWPGWSPDRLRAIRAPALVIIGDNDFTRIEHAAEMKRLIPGAQLAVLPGTTHMSIMQQGDWIVPMLEQRLASAKLT
jgi:pimeloyl-ACP methyl ester carboxylesterase